MKVERNDYDNKIIKKINKRVHQYRAQIPDEYNQIELLDYLTNDQIELFVSISTRSDGKTFGYLGTLFMLAMEFEEIRLLILCRHDELKSHYANTIDSIIEKFNLKRDKFVIKPSSVGVRIYYNNVEIACISDLNDATDLKNDSAHLSKFKILVYDEFLASKYDYNPDEQYQLETIIGSVNRSPELNPVFPHPKLFLLGNAVNFDSPILAYYDLLNYFETQKMNTLEIYDFRAIEIRKNTRVQEKNTTRLVSSDAPAMTAAFDINSTLVIPFKEKSLYTKKIVIKVDNISYLLVKYRNPEDFYIEVNMQTPEKYDYCINLADYREGVTQLVDFDFNRFSHFEFDEHRIKFGNTYTIQYMDSNSYLKDLDYTDLIERVNKEEDILESAKEMEESAKVTRVYRKFSDGGF